MPAYTKVFPGGTSLTSDRLSEEFARPSRAELPELLRKADGSAISTARQWRQHVKEIGPAWIDLVYGALPPKPGRTRAQLLHRIESASSGGAVQSHWRIPCAPARQQAFTLSLLRPSGRSRYPVILSGDACWRYASDQAVHEILRRGYALAQFNRIEIAPDPPDLRARPRSQAYGAIATWAWAYMRCVDALQNMDDIDARAIAVTGHSRGGKAALLAGALDQRIALTHANNSGTGGSGSFHAMGGGSETLAQLVGAYPHWMGRDLAAYAGRETELPFDQHLIKAMIAPRALLTTDARGDLWANPSGCRLSFEAAREVYRLLGATERCAITMREGGHPMLMQDWTALLDFADAQMSGSHSGHFTAGSGPSRGADTCLRAN